MYITLRYRSIHMYMHVYHPQVQPHTCITQFRTIFTYITHKYRYIYVYINPRYRSIYTCINTRYKYMLLAVHNPLRYICIHIPWVELHV
ncbi:hypothetical protein GDO78_003370 [Eleutherodactylus coqui]|uniref:Uncharacterized protein n=1 Tax=Eleutherodactylus coqui TaxID=57060 RepID=A0A8J6ETV6_ELECQ|nr:hypothetical protein GDO78_003370 [Eleutherodactylus coqui]